MAAHDGLLESGPERQPLGVLLLASLDNGREAEKAGKKRHHSKENEVDDKPTREAGQSSRLPLNEGWCRIRLQVRMRLMRPVWGERPLFIVRACMITLAALAFVIWAVAAPRIVSPSPAPPLAAPAGSAPKPLKIPIRSFPAAQASISSTPILSKHASGSYSSLSL